MNITIQSKAKIDIFVALFQTIKNSVQNLNIVLTEEKLHIQGIDLSQCCLFNINICKWWFTEYSIDKSFNICINADMFLKVLSLGTNQKDTGIELCVKSGELDCLYINFNNFSKTNINKYFTVPLQEIEEYCELSIPENEYEADITFPSKKLCEIINQLSSFSDDLHDVKIISNSTAVKFITQGATGGEFIVEIEPQHIIEYAINEDAEVVVSYSLKYLHKLCLTNKISDNIKISISNKCPMKIQYDLGDDSILVYYITPKIEE